LAGLAEEVDVGALFLILSFAASVESSDLLEGIDGSPSDSNFRRETNREELPSTAESSREIFVTFEALLVLSLRVIPEEIFGSDFFAFNCAARTSKPKASIPIMFVVPTPFNCSAAILGSKDILENLLRSLLAISLAQQSAAATAKK
jgi:hypothetical protein